MHAPVTPLKPLSSIQLTPDETKIVQWIRGSKWEAQVGEREPIPYKTKVPEFYSGVRLYRSQAGGGGLAAGSTLENFIKKLGFQGIISKQDLYPVSAQGATRFLSLKKADLDNLGVGGHDEEDE